MKILQCIYQFQSGGGSLQVVCDLARAARATGHIVDVLARAVPVAVRAGAEPFFTGNKLRDWWQLRERLRRGGYDLAHVHDRYCALLLRLQPAAPPSVQTNHIAYRTFRRLTRFADCVVGCSQDLDRHHAEFFGLPASRRATITNGVTVRPPHAEVIQRLRTSLPPAVAGRKLCLTVARLSTQKGHTYLIEAIARLDPALRRDWAFVWCGGGELEPHLRGAITATGLACDVVLVGNTPDVPEWLAMAEAFVLPSLYEGLPLALLEAMAAGLPCLATDVGGNGEALVHGNTGLLCPAGDPAALSTALALLLSDAGLRRRLGGKARAAYERHWTFERTWSEYENLYRRLVTARSQPRSLRHV
jgi:glycosyltransferase involved in cell wall biosynthesis